MGGDALRPRPAIHQAARLGRARESRTGFRRPTLGLGLLAWLVLAGTVVGCRSPGAGGKAGLPATPSPTAAAPHVWAHWERAAILSLGLQSLPEPPPDPSNRLAEEETAIELGYHLFFDAGLSANGRISCASCHVPALGFADGLPLARGLGEVARGTPSLIGIGWSPWFYWDGRKDSAWAQAMAPMQAPAEMGRARVDLARALQSDYAAELRALGGASPDLEDRARFPAGAGPDAADPRNRAAWTAMSPVDRDNVNRVVVLAGKAIAAYERLLRPAPVALDRYVNLLHEHHDGPTAEHRATLSDEQAQGLRLFVGKAECTHCHNGPRLTNDDFHNIGLGPLEGRPADLGRADGLHALAEDAFRCDKGYSDAAPEDCLELRFLKTEGPTLAGAFKVPTLRGVAGTAPFMHDGRFETLEQVVAHYDAAAPAMIGISELVPLGLTDVERRQLVAFLTTLAPEVETEARWLVAPRD